MDLAPIVESEERILVEVIEVNEETDSRYKEAQDVWKSKKCEDLQQACGKRRQKYADQEDQDPGPSFRFCLEIGMPKGKHQFLQIREGQENGKGVPKVGVAIYGEPPLL